MITEAIKHMDNHERTMVYIALLQDMHTLKSGISHTEVNANSQRSELNRLENIVKELQEIENAAK